MKILVPVCLLAVLVMQLSCARPMEGQSIEIAKDYYVHNVKGRALESFIDVFHNSKAPEVKAEALYYMGQVAFEDNNYSAAFNDWTRLIKDYPTSKQAAEIKDRLTQMREVMGKVTSASILSTAAGSYLRNGDFWSRGSDKRFMIDSSWLPSVELANAWYDKTIAEFPGSEAAEIAYQTKLFTILGWTEPGQYGSRYGIEADFKKYLPLLTQTFSNFETAFPKSPYLQGFRYQIAQVYWKNRDWQNTREWLNKIIQAGDGRPSFYTETAKARLNKVEH
jgi:tetratricopeptide (TPR) repeat protein